jgi:hypothetical protein
MILLGWQVRGTSSGSGSIAQAHARVKLPLLDALGLMEYQIIPLSCKCGKIPRFISPPALTADHQLLIALAVYSVPTIRLLPKAAF